MSTLHECQTQMISSMNRTPSQHNPSARLSALATTLLMLVLLLMPWKSFASCTLNPTTVVKTISSPPSITINPYVAVGSVLYTGTFTGNSGTFTVTCTTSFTQLVYQGVGVATSNTYPTNIPGIGMQLSNTSGNTGLWPITITQGAATTFTAQASLPVQLQLVKTGPITASGTLPVNVGSLVLPQQGNFVLFNINLQTPLVVNFTQPSCAVTSSSPIAVALGAFPISHFPSVGSTSSPIPFSIQVTCQQGPNGSSTSIYATLTDNSGVGVGAGNTSNILPLSATSTAAGLGVQIQYNGTVQKFGPDSNVIGNTNQFLLQANNANGTYTFPFTAYFIRTGTVVAGSAKTSATFTMAYN